MIDIEALKELAAAPGDTGYEYLAYRMADNANEIIGEMEEARKRITSLEEALEFMLDRFDRPTNLFSQRLACEKARKALRRDDRQKKDAP